MQIFRLRRAQMNYLQAINILLTDSDGNNCWSQKYLCIWNFDG